MAMMAQFTKVMKGLLFPPPTTRTTQELYRRFFGPPETPTETPTIQPDINSTEIPILLREIDDDDDDVSNQRKKMVDLLGINVLNLRNQMEEEEEPEVAAAVEGLLRLVIWKAEEEGEVEKSGKEEEERRSQKEKEKKSTSEEEERRSQKGKEKSTSEEKGKGKLEEEQLVNYIDHIENHIPLWVIRLGFFQVNVKEILTLSNGVYDLGEEEAAAATRMVIAIQITAQELLAGFHRVEVTSLLPEGSPLLTVVIVDLDTKKIKRNYTRYVEINIGSTKRSTLLQYRVPSALDYSSLAFLAYEQARAIVPDVDVDVDVRYGGKKSVLVGEDIRGSISLQSFVDRYDLKLRGRVRLLV